jgi:hypothetical protein
VAEVKLKRSAVLPVIRDGELVGYMDVEISATMMLGTELPEEKSDEIVQSVADKFGKLEDFVAW